MVYHWQTYDGKNKQWHSTVWLAPFCFVEDGHCKNNRLPSEKVVLY